MLFHAKDIMTIEKGTGNRPLFLLTVSKKVLTVRTFPFYRLNLYGKGLTYLTLHTTKVVWSVNTKTIAEVEAYE